MTTAIIDNGIFEYASQWEKQFEGYLDFIGGHGKRKTTFVHDLSLAEPFGSDAVKDTDRRVMKEWLSNYKYIAEYIMGLNFKCNMWARHAELADDERMKAKCNEFSSLYADLFYSAQDKAYKHHESNDEAVSYLFHYLD